MDTFDTSKEKIRKIYINSKNTQDVIQNKTNDEKSNVLESNIIKKTNILDDTKDIVSPLNFGISVTQGAIVASEVSYFYAKNFKIPSYILPFLEYETSIKPRGTQYLAPAYIDIHDDWMTGWIEIKGDGELIWRGVSLIPLSIKTGIYSDNNHNITVSQTDIDNGNVLMSHCQLIPSGPLAGRFQVYYDIDLLWPLEFSVYNNNGSIGFSLNHLPWQTLMVPVDNPVPTVLPYSAITVDINKDGYPLRISEFNNLTIPDYTTVSFSSSDPVYFRMSKSTDKQETWQSNLYFYGFVLDKASQLSSTLNFISWTDTYTPIGSYGNTRWDYEKSIESHSTVPRNYYTAASGETTTRVRVVAGSPLSWKENKKSTIQTS